MGVVSETLRADHSIGVAVALDGCLNVTVQLLQAYLSNINGRARDRALVVTVWRHNA